MAAWGIAISSNDTYADIYGTFFNLYNDGLAVVEIAERLVADNKETISDRYDSNNFWFALAKAKWECKELDTDLLNRIKELIESGSDLEIWRELGADKEDINKRKIVLKNFLKALQTERPKAKSRKPKTNCQPIFEKGDCLSFKLKSGNFGGAVVLEAVKDTEYGYNLIATTRINQANKPTKKDFENAEILVMSYASWKNKPNVQWYLPIRHEQFAHLIEKVDTLKVQINYDKETSMFSSMADFDIWIIQVVDEQLESEQTKPYSWPKQTIKNLIRNNKWKFW